MKCSLLFNIENLHPYSLGIRRSIAYEAFRGYLHISITRLVQFHINIEEDIRHRKIKLSMREVYAYAHTGSPRKGNKFALKVLAALDPPLRFELIWVGEIPVVGVDEIG